MKRLLVVADDVGLHPAMTDAAVRAHRDGIVTACSVVACGRALEHAVETLRSVPRLAVGVHLALVEERPLSDPARIPSLVGSGGRFHRNFGTFSRRWFTGRIDLAEVRRELRAQVDAVAGTGLPIEHLNSHQHLHALPRLFELVLDLAREFSIPWVRVPLDPGTGGARGARRAGLFAMNVFARRARRVAAARGIASAERTAGIASAGHHDLESLLAIVRAVEGTTELVVHPGASDRDLSAAYDWGYAWERELDALCSPELRAEVARQGIELIAPG
ncbi:MAG TPA: ChbG/HpnK family deacetylase [Thermoanaerobaculia bacterium]